MKRVEEVLSWDKPKEIRTATILSFTKNKKQPFEAEFGGIEITPSKKKKRLPWRSKNYEFGSQHDIGSLSSVIVVLHGHVATGKKSVTDAIAKGLGYNPLYSDLYWFKYGLGKREHDRGISATHNKHMLGRYWFAFGSGYNVVLDCTSRWLPYRNDIGLNPFIPY